MKESSILADLLAERKYLFSPPLFFKTRTTKDSSENPREDHSSAFPEKDSAGAAELGFCLALQPPALLTVSPEASLLTYAIGHNLS